MPGPRKTKKQLEDEAWLRNQQLQAPLDLPEQPQDRSLPYHATVPGNCPKCSKLMTVFSGWTLMFGDILQCGGCGASIEVPRSEYERLAKKIHDAHPHGDGYKPPPKGKGPKVRGAG